jgi:curved DNA-binding protein CbpA
MTRESPPQGGLALLAEAFRAKRTGMLVLGEGSGALRVKFEGGQVVALGPVPAEATALPMPKPNDSVRLRLERVLTEIGVRKAPAAGQPPADAEQGTLRERLIERLADPSQPARFEPEGESAEPQSLIGVAVATEPLILEAVRQLRHDDAVRGALGDLDRRLVATTALADERTLTLTEGYLLSRIDGLVSARQVLQLVPLDPSETERTLLGLMLTGRVECRPAPPALARPAAAGAPAAKPAAAEASGPAPAPAPEPSAAAPSAPSEPAAEATAEPADEPIVPAHETAQAEAAADSIEALLDEDDEAAPAEGAGTGAYAAATTADAPDPATLERRREILALFQSLPLKNHFEVLGVEPGCDDAEARRAYVALAKRYHPDSQRDRRLEDLHDILEAIFIRVGEAWEVLGDAKSRASYEQRAGIVRQPRVILHPPVDGAAAAPPPAASPSASSPAPSQEPGEYVPPEEILHQARRLLAQARYWDAIQVLETALPGMEPRSQQHRGRLILARAYSKNPNWLRRAEETLQAVLREDPTNADAHYELGLVYRSFGFAARAQGMFRRALELRPGHKGASAALGIQEPEGGVGLFKRIFGRGKAS